MRLKEKARNPATEDRTELNERMMAGATPGQKVIGGLASVLAVAVILGVVGWKYWHAEPVSSTGMQGQGKGASAPPTSPKLNLPAEVIASAPTQPTATPPLPPGMAGSGDNQPAPAYGPGGQQYGSATHETYTPGNTQPSAADQQRLADEKAIHDRKLAGSMGDMGDAGSATKKVSANLPSGNGAATLPASLIGGAENGKGKNDFSSQLVPTSTPKVSATVIPNPSLTVKKGTPIRCTLDTAINSDNPSFPVCTVSQPVYGMDGRVVLIEPGSTIDGEVPKGPDRGKNRAGALWGRIVTPEAVAINVNSPTTDLLGAGGMEGSIDNHYCARYCGAFLYSAVEDLMQAGVSAAGSTSGSGGTNIVLPQNTISSGQSTAGAILTENKDVQPTFSKNQGDEITITVARDLDFSSAYHLTPVDQ